MIVHIETSHNPQKFVKNFQAYLPLRHYSLGIIFHINTFDSLQNTGIFPNVTYKTITIIIVASSPASHRIHCQAKISQKDQSRCRKEKTGLSQKSKRQVVVSICPNFYPRKKKRVGIWDLGAPVSVTHQPLLSSELNPIEVGQHRALSSCQFGNSTLVAMWVRAHLLLVLCLLGAGAGAAVVGAQSFPPRSTLQPQGVAPPPKPTPFGRTMSTVITVAISVFFFLLFFCAYINQCRLADDGAPQGAPVAAAAGGGASRRGKRGLDPAVVATFPIVPYREIKEHKIGRGVLECAVCLTAFEEGDDLRLLPHCSHAFHPECIDPWLEARVTCPLCRANLEKPAPAAVAPPSPEQVAARRQPSPSPSPSPPHAVAIPVREEEEDSDEDDRKEEAMELEMLRSERRAARLPRSHSTGHSLFAASAAAAERSDHERFTLRLPQHVREEVLRSRRLRHATSLINLSGMSPEGSSHGGRRVGGGGSFGNAGGGGASTHGGRRWQAFLARTVSWARGGGDGSVRKGWGDGSTRRGRDDAESSRKGAGSPSPAAARP